MPAENHSSIALELTPEQSTYVDGLRTLADVLEDNPDLFGVVEPSALTFHRYFLEPEEMTALVRAVGGTWTKESDGSYFNLNRDFGPHRIQAYVEHSQVCERVVTTETVTREVPDPDALAAVPTITVTEEVEHVEWRCPESLLQVGGDPS